VSVPKPADAFLRNLASNWKQSASEIDKAKALGMAVRKFHFNTAETCSIVMPLLGLSEDKALLELFLKADRFSDALKELIEKGFLPFRSVTFLAKFSESDQEYFVRVIGARMKLTSSQFLQSGEWLADIAKGSGRNLKEIFDEYQILKGLSVRGMDPRTRADKVFARIKKIRFPDHSKYLEQFEAMASRVLWDAKEFRLEPVQGFEERGFELHARVKNEEAMDRLLSRLSEKRAALNSLFEIML
jgi:hypothetical protein